MANTVVDNSEIALPSWQRRDDYCERCGELIKWDRIVWLDYRTSDNTYHINGVMQWNDPDNQGAFPFGAKCAERAIRDGVN